MLTFSKLKAVCSVLDTSKPFYVAYSGGVDSHVLLHALKTLQVQGLSIQLHAVHVNHHLQASSDAWAAHCQAVCDRLAVPLLQLSVCIDKKSGESLEALARAARYGVVAKALPKGAYLLTGHHQDDQAETVLLQLLRGAGPKGLSAMPFQKTCQGVTIARPLLTFSRQSIEVYAREKALNWVEDDSNADRDFQRNVLRHDVLPLLKKTWPGAAETLSRSAQHCAEAVALLALLAETDLHACLVGQNTLHIPALNLLSAPRCKQVIRHWLSQLGFDLPPTTKLQQILDEVIPARPDANPLVAWAGAEVRRYRESLYANKPFAAFDHQQIFLWDVNQPLTLPSGLGQLLATQTCGNGLKVSEVQGLLEVRFRQGGETCYLPGRLGAHSLKHLFQEWGVPTWERDRVPLIYYQGQLICVFGFCVCDGFLAENNEPAWLIQQKKPAL